MSEVKLNEYIDRIVDLAKQVETEDPIDWGMLELNEEDAYRLIALNTIEHLNKYNANERDVIIATITKLVVENFVLHMKLKGQTNGN